jgi:hypothetical protein
MKLLVMQFSPPSLHSFYNYIIILLYYYIITIIYYSYQLTQAIGQYDWTSGDRFPVAVGSPLLYCLQTISEASTVSYSTLPSDSLPGVKLTEREGEQSSPSSVEA